MLIMFVLMLVAMNAVLFLFFHKLTSPVGHICDAINESDEPNIEVLYDLSELFKVFGDSTRIRILTALTAGEMCVLHLAEHLDMGQSAVSHQLRILRTAGPFPRLSTPFSCFFMSKMTISN